MQRNSRNAAGLEPVAGAKAPTSNVAGILQMLSTAQASIAAYCADDYCADLIEQCASHLQERYGYAAAPPSDQTMAPESSLVALVRLLAYVQVEITEDLRELRCASLIKQCIDHLLHTHLLYHECLRERAACTAH